MDKFSGRKVGSIFVASSKSSPPTFFKLLLSIFLRCPKAWAVIFSRICRLAGNSGRARGIISNKVDVTLGFGWKAEGGISKSILGHASHCVIIDSLP